MLSSIALACSIESLLKRQKAKRLTDKQFASLLGVHRTTWALIKHGKRSINLAFVRGVLRAFPDLDEEVLDFLRP